MASVPHSATSRARSTIASVPASVTSCRGMIAADPDGPTAVGHDRCRSVLDVGVGTQRGVQLLFGEAEGVPMLSINRQVVTVKVEPLELDALRDLRMIAPESVKDGIWTFGRTRRAASIAKHGANAVVKRAAEERIGRGIIVHRAEKHSEWGSSVRLC